MGRVCRMKRTSLKCVDSKQSLMKKNDMFAQCTKSYEIDLSLPEEERWEDVISAERTLARKVCKDVLAQIEPVPQLARLVFEKIYRLAGGRYVGEMEAWASALNVSLGDMAVIQCSYEFAHLRNVLMRQGGEIFKRFGGLFGCTAGIHQTRSLGMVHVRSMDWPMRHGGEATRIFKFRDGERVFYSVGVLGLIGVLSGMLPGAYSVTINWAEPQTAPNPLAFGPLFLLREAMETCDSYEAVVYKLSKTELASPVFFVVCGAKRGQGCVIERTKTSASVRRWKDEPLTQGNHYECKRFLRHNAPILEAEEGYENLFDDSVARTDLMSEMLVEHRQPASVRSLSAVVRKSPIRNIETVHQMAFHPKSGSLCVWARR